MNRIKPVQQNKGQINTNNTHQRRQSRASLGNHKTVSNYQIKETIGIGGFAKVRRAIHTLTGQTVAVKIISLIKLSNSQKDALWRQIQIHKNLMHQNIAQIYQVHQENEQIYIFMEYCEKGQLFDYINENGPLSKKQARMIFLQVYSAVCYLHQSFIAHRDIKTQNILLDGDGNAKLIDFGLSSYYGENKEDKFLKTFCGSPSYLSPEMLLRCKYDPKMVDVWCLGVTLYAMIKAQLPFYTPDANEQKQKIKRLNYHAVGDRSVDELLSDIFTLCSLRVSLEGIKNYDFCQKGKPYNASFLSSEAQPAAIDEQLIQSIARDHQISPKLMRQSIREKKMNKLSSLYYLTLEMNRKNGIQSCYDVNSPTFMKGLDLRKSKNRVRISRTIDTCSKASRQTSISEHISPKNSSKTPQLLKPIKMTISPDQLVTQSIQMMKQKKRPRRNSEVTNKKLHQIARVGVKRSLFGLTPQ